jgi:hypothetical protein
LVRYWREIRQARTSRRTGTVASTAVSLDLNGSITGSRVLTCGLSVAGRVVTAILAGVILSFGYLILRQVALR